jgi:hypothetical protein
LAGAPQVEVTLHHVAQRLGHSDRVHISCNCKVKCGPRCTCKKNQKVCTQYCHAAEGLECGNKGTILEGTEQAVVERKTRSAAKRGSKEKNNGKRPLDAAITIPLL